MGEFDHIVGAMQASSVFRELARMGESGNYDTLESNGAKRHHFVSQFVLRGFSRDADAEFVFQMIASGRGAPIRVPIRTAASRRRFYAVPDDDGKLSNRNEGYLALIEREAAKAIRRLLRNPSAVSPGERATIAYFVAFQTMRTPAAAEQTTDVANGALKMAASEYYSDRVRFARDYRERNGASASDDEIEQFRRELVDQVRSGGVRLTGKEAALTTGFEHAAETIPLITACDWVLLRDPEGGFITSDRGYAMDDPTPPYPWAAPGLLSSESSETTIPLSASACLLVRPSPMWTGSPGVSERILDQGDVEDINLRTYGWASEYVFGTSQEALAALRRTVRARPGAVKRPKPFCFVALIESDPDDDSLAVENQRRGWPEQLPDEAGQLHDYLVIPTDRPHEDLWRRADELTEARARKRAGLQAGGAVEGRITNRPIDPGTMSGKWTSKRNRPSVRRDDTGGI